MQGKLKEGIPGISKEIVGIVPTSMLIHSGNLGILIKIDPPPQSEHQMIGRMLVLL